MSPVPARRDLLDRLMRHAVGLRDSTRADSRRMFRADRWDISFGQLGLMGARTFVSAFGCRNGLTVVHVCPRLSANDRRDRGEVDAVSAPEGAKAIALRVRLPYLSDLIDRHFRPVVRFAVRWTRRVTRGATLFHEHVGEIVALGSDEEVVRANAQWRVASMANAHALRNGAMRDLPRDAMRCSVLPVPLPLAVSAKPSGERPEPALARLVNKGPKTFRGMPHFHECSTTLVNEAAV